MKLSDIFSVLSQPVSAIELTDREAIQGIADMFRTLYGQASGSPSGPDVERWADGFADIRGVRIVKRDQPRHDGGLTCASADWYYDTGHGYAPEAYA